MAFARRAPAPPLLGQFLGQLHARHGTCARAMAPPRCFALELPDCTLAHFALGADAPGLRSDPRLAALLGPPGRSYSLCVPLAAGVGCGERVRAARLTQRLLLQLRRGPFQRCRLSRLLCYCPEGPAGGAQHGFLLQDPRDGPDTRRALLQLLGQGAGAALLHLGEFQVDRHGGLWQRLWALQDGAQRQVGCARVVPAHEPALHPAVPDLPSSAVFPDRAAARDVLEAVSSVPPLCSAWHLHLPDPRAGLSRLGGWPLQSFLLGCFVYCRSQVSRDGVLCARLCVRRCGSGEVLVCQQGAACGGARATRLGTQTPTVGLAGEEAAEEVLFFARFFC